MRDTKPSGRRRRVRLGLTGLTSLCLMAVALSPAQTQARPLSPECQAAVEARLGQAGIATNEIREQSVARRGSGGEASHFIGYSVWLKSERCPGSIVVDLSPSCEIEQAYTRGDCRITGLGHW